MGGRSESWRYPRPPPPPPPELRDLPLTSGPGLIQVATSCDYVCRHDFLATGELGYKLDSALETCTLGRMQQTLRVCLAITTHTCARQSYMHTWVTCSGGWKRVAGWIIVSSRQRERGSRKRERKRRLSERADRKVGVARGAKVTP